MGIITCNEYESFCNQLSTELRRARIKKEITQRDLALSIEVHPLFISQLEVGTRLPSINTLLNIAKAVNCKLNITLEPLK